MTLTRANPICSQGPIPESVKSHKDTVLFLLILVWKIMTKWVGDDPPSIHLWKSLISDLIALERLRFTVKRSFWLFRLKIWLKSSWQNRTKTHLWSSHLLAVSLPVPACRFMPPQLETHNGSNQIHNHSDKQKDNGCSLTRLHSAEHSIDAVVEDGVETKTSTIGVTNVNDTWLTEYKH